MTCRDSALFFRHGFLMSIFWPNMVEVARRLEKTTERWELRGLCSSASTVVVNFMLDVLELKRKVLREPDGR